MSRENHFYSPQVFRFVKCRTQYVKNYIFKMRLPQGADFHQLLFWVHQQLWYRWAGFLALSPLSWAWGFHKFTDLLPGCSNGPERRQTLSNCRPKAVLLCLVSPLHNSDQLQMAGTGFCKEIDCFSLLNTRNWVLEKKKKVIQLKESMHFLPLQMPSFK